MTLGQCYIGAGVFGYCVAHFLGYIFLVRTSRWGQRERGIFIYHAGSFLLVTLAVTAIVVMTGMASPIVVIASAVAIHGLYSLTFLEAWSVTEGSYSLSILDAVDTAERDGTDLPWDQLAAIEGAKRNDRLGGLRRLGLVRDEQGSAVLTATGRLAAAILAAIAWTAHGSGNST